MTACGGEDGETGERPSAMPAPTESGGQAQTAGEESGAGRSSDEGAPTPAERQEREARRVAVSYSRILAAEEGEGNSTTIDSAAFCELMSEAARRQTVRYAEVSSGLDQEWDCESAVELLAIRSRRARDGDRASGVEVIGVNAEGNRASATIRFGDGPATSIPLVREGSEWKLAATVPAGGG